MKIHGTISDNLSAALRSITRLRGQRVYRETIHYWYELLAYARANQPTHDVEDGGMIAQQIAALASELGQMEQAGSIPAVPEEVKPMASQSSRHMA